MFKRVVLRKLILIATAIVAVILQSSVPQLFSMSAPFPNILIVLTCVVGFTVGKREGIYAGFVCGIIYDFTFGGLIGVNALLFMYIGFINGIFKRVYYTEDYNMPIILVAASDFLYNFFIYIFCFLVRSKMNFSYYLSHNIIPEMVMTVIFLLITYKLFLMVNKKINFIEKGSVTLLD